jgi:diguanylate cyclase (GGDEF)-like protein
MKPMKVLLLFKEASHAATIGSHLTQNVDSGKIMIVTDCSGKMSAIKDLREDFSIAFIDFNFPIACILNAAQILVSSNCKIVLVKPENAALESNGVDLIEEMGKIGASILKPASIPELLLSIVLECNREYEHFEAVWNADHDSKTEVLSYRAIVKKIKDNLQQSGNVSVIFVDINDFKNLNETYGRTAMDSILFEFAQRISKHIRERDSIGRWGGDEFLLVIPGKNPKIVSEIVKRIFEVISVKFVFSNGKNISLSVSAGVVFSWQIENPSPEILTFEADRLAQMAGKDGILFYGKHQKILEDVPNGVS